MSCLRISTLFLSLFATLITTTPVRADLLAQNPPTSTGEMKMPAGGVGKLAKELNLSPDQIQRLQKMRLDSKGKTKERRLALRTAKQELAQLLQGNGSSDQIRQKRQQVQSLQREVSDVNFENTLAIREILTPEQRVKLQQLMQQRRQNRGKLK
jgi:Spy/CpxP family protein refolding chaperone